MIEIAFLHRRLLPLTVTVVRNFSAIGSSSLRKIKTLEFSILGKDPVLYLFCKKRTWDQNLPSSLRIDLDLKLAPLSSRLQIERLKKPMIPSLSKATSFLRLLLISALIFSNRDILRSAFASGKIPLKPIIHFQTWRVGILIFLNFISFGYAGQRVVVATAFIVVGNVFPCSIRQSVT